MNSLTSLSQKLLPKSKDNIYAKDKQIFSNQYLQNIALDNNECYNYKKHKDKYKLIDSKLRNTMNTFSYGISVKSSPEVESKAIHDEYIITKLDSTNTKENI